MITGTLFVDWNAKNGDSGVITTLMNSDAKS
jgi:hypothetical protein